MPSPLVVIAAVGLTSEHLGSDTPTLTGLAAAGFNVPLPPSLPAVTTTAQTTMLTGVDPDRHGIVANGWYFRDLGEVWLWRQSQALIQAPLVWQDLRPGLRVLKHFWWYAMNTDVTASVTPRPAYHADGRKSPDIHAWPPGLKDELLDRHGPFPLFRFWGPTADLRSTRWIADSFVTAFQRVRPDLSLVYLPHLDYDLQRFGPQGPHLAPALRGLDDCCRIVFEAARAGGAEILVVSEYGIEAVDQPVPINRHLRQAGLLTVCRNATGELLDPGNSRAFAVADHQIAHVYCRTPADQEAAATALRELPGLQRLEAGSGRGALGLDHPRSGELVALAAPGAWFTYDYWLDPALAPDFAQTVDIHRKPGYDPRELLFDPQGGRRRALWALARKMLGFRYRLAAIPLDATLIRGSHGLSPSRPACGPLALGTVKDWAGRLHHQRDVAGVIGRWLAG